MGLKLNEVLELNYITSRRNNRRISLRISNNIDHNSQRTNGWQNFLLYYIKVVDEYPKKVNDNEVLKRLTDIHSLDKGYFKFNE
jgi:hypothetical protein